MASIAANKTGKMSGFINYQVRATMQDGRRLSGQMLAFDKFMNLVLADCQESRTVKKKPAKGAQAAQADGSILETEETRTLGLVILRGNNVVSVTVTGEPPADPASRLGNNAGTAGAATLAAGPGISKPAGRGAGISLQGPAAGVGGPGFGGGPPGFPPQGFAPPGMPAGFAPPGFPGRGMPPGGPPAGFGGPPGGPPPGYGRGGTGFPPQR